MKTVSIKSIKYRFKCCYPSPQLHNNILEQLITKTTTTMEAVGISYLHPNIHEIILWFDRRADLVIVMIDCHNYCGLRVEVIREVDNLEGIKLKAQYRKVTKGDYKHIHTTIGLSLFDCSGHYI